MNKAEIVVQPKPKVGFFQWLIKIISLPKSVYKFIFEREIRNSLPNKVVFITGKIALAMICFYIAVNSLIDLIK